jgi:hypothetical protein
VLSGCCLVALGDREQGLAYVYAGGVRALLLELVEESAGFG